MAHGYTTREEHPIPAIIMHWVHLISMVVLIYTGFYIHRPFGPGSMDVMRTLHFIFMFVLIVTAIARVYWAFLGAGSAMPGSRRRIRDYRHFGRSPENKGQAFQTVKYYLFLRKTHPRSAKYNTLQKGTYFGWLILIILQAITGFALWTNTDDFFRPMTYALGGPMMIRAIHYVIMWLFIITTMIHIYLSVAESWRQLPLMFSGREYPGRDHPADTPAERTGAARV